MPNLVELRGLISYPKALIETVPNLVHVGFYRLSELYMFSIKPLFPVSSYTVCKVYLYVDNLSYLELINSL